MSHWQDAREPVADFCNSIYLNDHVSNYGGKQNDVLPKNMKLQNQQFNFRSRQTIIMII